mgnify:CR=1 FL=1
MEAWFHFDIKQMICHLLGVATKLLAPIQKGKPTFHNVDGILFLYLLYNPANLEIDNPTARSQIMDIYTDICRSCLSFDFKTMFGHMVDFLVDRRKKSNKPIPEDNAVNYLKSCFGFALCDQFDYHTYFWWSFSGWAEFYLVMGAFE